MGTLTEKAMRTHLGLDQFALKTRLHALLQRRQALGPTQVVRDKMTKRKIRIRTQEMKDLDVEIAKVTRTLKAGALAVKSLGGRRRRRAQQSA